MNQTYVLENPTLGHTCSQEDMLWCKHDCRLQSNNETIHPDSLDDSVSIKGPN